MKNKIILMAGNQVQKKDYKEFTDKNKKFFEDKNLNTRTDLPYNYDGSSSSETIYMFCMFFVFDDIASAEKKIKLIFDDYFIILLINNIDSECRLYKGPSLAIIKSLYLPTFINVFYLTYKEECLYPEKIQDVTLTNSIFINKSKN